MVLDRYVEQDKTTRMTTLLFLLSALSPFVISDSTCALILCRRYKSNTFWNILMLLGRNVVQDNILRTRMRTLAFFLLSYLPLYYILI